MFARSIPIACLLLAGCMTTRGPTPEEIAAQAVIATPKEWAESCQSFGKPGWEEAAPPYRIYGNTYHVGTCGLSAFLIVGDEGAILLDSGPSGAADAILANIAALGLSPSDVKLMAFTHEHYDHVGASARIQTVTGADLIASPASRAVLETGQVDVNDPQLGMLENMEPVTVGWVIAGAQKLHLGNIAIQAIPSPGHSLGAYSWSWQSCEVNACKSIVLADSFSPVSNDTYRFSDRPDYVASYRAALTQVGALPCDILLSGHPESAGTNRNALKGIAGGDMSCAEYTGGAAKRLDERLAEEATSGG